MNVHELPMILFTVIAQMCVGMFIILGVVELWLSAKADEKRPIGSSPQSCM